MISSSNVVGWMVTQGDKDCSNLVTCLACWLVLFCSLSVFVFVFLYHFAMITEIKILQTIYIYLNISQLIDALIFIKWRNP